MPIINHINKVIIYKITKNTKQICLVNVSGENMIQNQFAYGADVGWMTQLQSQGVKWADRFGNDTEPLAELKKMGTTAVRFRIFVNPPEDGYWHKEKRIFDDFTVGGENCMLGFCDPESVIQVAKKAYELKLDIMLDFHYSDHFADPFYQDIPKAWEDHSFEELQQDVEKHTKEVLQGLKEEGVIPKWVQVGNEIDNGILKPVGDAKEHTQRFVALLTKGYEAVKEVFPDCLVVTHGSTGYDPEKCIAFFDRFFALGGKTDILGFSYYPYWMKMLHDPVKLHKDMEQVIEKFHKPIMLVEIGGPEDEEESTYTLLRTSVNAIATLKDGMGAGVFYWEPEIGAGVLPDHYPLGASKAISKDKIQFSKIMTAYEDAAREGKL